MTVSVCVFPVQQCETGDVLIRENRDRDKKTPSAEGNNNILAGKKEAQADRKMKRSSVQCVENVG